MAEEIDCIFCKIAQGKAPSTVVWENDEFVAFVNKFPEAPIHLLVIPKAHIEKTETRKKGGDFWGPMMQAVWAVVEQEGLDKKGYKLENNGAGYNDIEHEHIHIISGLKRRNS